MSIRKTVYGMPERGSKGIEKQAFNLTQAGAEIWKMLTQLGTTGSLYLLASAMGTGALAGWGAAKMTAHGERELDTARKSYENQRLRADIGYLKGRIEQESATAQQKQQTNPRSARVLGL